MEPGKNPARPDLTAVSQACGLEINRRVYRRLGEMGWHLQIVADATFPGTTKPTEPQAAWERGLHRLERRGSRTRYHTYRGLNELLGRLRPRAVLLDLEPDSFLAWQLGRWCRKNGAPLIIQSCENLSAHFWKSLLGLRLKTAVRAGTMRAVNFLTRPLIAHVLGISAGVVEQMVRLGYGGRCSQIPLGFDPAIFTEDPAARAEKRRALGLVNPTVGYFGRLTPVKGVHLLIGALAGLKHLPWQFLVDDFAESGSAYAEQLTALIAKHGIADRVVYFRAAHGEMPAFMNAADIVALPSITTATSKEQYGRVIPEAMACGRAMIVSDCGAFPELAGDAAIIIPESDVPALRVAIESLLADEPARQRLGAAGKLRAAEHFTLGVQAVKMDAVLRQLPAPTAA